MTEPFQPIAVATLELSELDASDRFSASYDADEHSQVMVMLTLCGEPVAAVTAPTQSILDGPRTLIPRASTALADAAARHGHGPFESPDGCRWRRASERLRADAEPISVVICTAGRPDRLRTTLASLSQVEYPEFELVLVDNAPRDDTNARILEEFRPRLDARYVVAPVLGLSRARNAGLRVAAHDLIAYTDDDVLLNSDWLYSILEAFRRSPHVGVVTGPVLPAEIATPAQADFERHGGLTKGRGFRRAVFAPHGQSPYFPLPPFAVGCNMTFRRSVLERVGGFDEALGAGTPAKAGEDTAAVAEVMLEGWSVAFEPCAVMWHFHRRTAADLSAQRRNYGIGLGAFYASLLHKDPRRLAPLVRLAPRAAMAILRRPSRGTTDTSALGSVSSVVTRRHMMWGPVAYRRGRRTLGRH